MKSLNAKTILALAALAALTACGGGSGGSSPAGNPVTPSTPVDPVTPVADKSSIVTSVPAATYAAGSEELAAFKLLNAERQHCGFGLLKQNAKLDTTAKNHADWVLINNNLGHGETPGTKGFTGISGYERAMNAGYGNGSFYPSAVADTTRQLKKGAAETEVRVIYGAPFHEIAAVRGYRDVGVSVRDVIDVGLPVTGGGKSVLNIDFAYTTADGEQKTKTHTVRTYPCDGTTGVNRLLDGESPSPMPDRNLAANPTGTTVIVVGDSGTELVIDTAKMVNAATGAEIKIAKKATAKTETAIPVPGLLLMLNEGYILPDTALEKMTKYAVTITGTNNSAPFTKTFTFTTGNQP